MAARSPPTRPRTSYVYPIPALLCRAGRFVLTPKPSISRVPQTFDISFTAAGDHFCIANSGGKVLVRSWASLLAGSSSSYMDVDGATKPQSATEIERPWEVDAQMGSCNALRFSRDGRFMATAGTDAIVNLWSTDGLIALKSFGDMTCVFSRSLQ